MAKNIENIIHNNLGHILTANSDLKKNFRHGIYLLKNTDNFTAKCKTAEKLTGVSVNFNKYVYGNPLPSTIESIGAAKSNFYTKELLFEIEWFMISARKYQAEISLFLTFKEDFENHFLLGNYKEAMDAIEQVEKIVGVSIWSLSSKFLVYEYTASQSKAKLLQSEILEKNKDGIFTTSLINFLSHRSERRLSAYQYDADLRNALNSVKTNLSQANKDFYNFQLNFFETIEFKEIKDVLCFDYCNPIVDRYLTYRKAIIYCVSNSTLSEEIFERIFYLNKKIKDDLFGTINLFFDDSFKDQEYFDAEHLKIVDIYYAGLYDQVCEQIKVKILKSGVDFNLVNLYSRACMSSN
jgi:tetratricopeptide (TPR) repeat protein